MKKFSLAACLFFISSFLFLHAQSIVSAKSINLTSVNLRGEPMVLAQIDMNIPSAGSVIVHFDGEAYLDVGDRLVLAANNSPSWTSNYGNVGVETNSIYIDKSFSHTRIFDYYEPDIGMHSFYAVGQNAVEQNGNGYGSIYGTLTVEFFPYSGPNYVHSTGITFNGDVTDPVAVVQQTIHASSAGKIIVRFDGWCMSDVGDRIVLAASNTTNWSADDGNVAVEATDGNVDLNTFSHTREYNVAAAGDYTYYGVVQNYEETDGNGMVWVYGNLTVEFYPNAGPDIVAFKGFAAPQINLNGQYVPLTSIMLDAPGPGTVIVDFDGDLTSDPTDYIEIGASNSLALPVNDGNLTLQAIDNDLNRNSFAHSRYYTVTAGQHTYYALGYNSPGGLGTGIANIYGELTVKYFPDQSTAVEDVAKSENDFNVFPDPSPGLITISFEQDAFTAPVVKLFDSSGRMLRQYQNTGNEDLNIDLSSLPMDMYWIGVGNKVKPVIKI